VNKPLESIAPIGPETRQVTPAFEFLTFAANWWVAPTLSDKADGATVTATACGCGGAAVTVIDALADLVLSCVDVAVTVPPPAVTAVNRPFELMVPSEVGLTVHATPAEELVNFGVN